MIFHKLYNNHPLVLLKNLLYFYFLELRQIIRNCYILLCKSEVCRFFSVITKHTEKKGTLIHTTFSLDNLLNKETKIEEFIIYSLIPISVLNAAFYVCTTGLKVVYILNIYDLALDFGTLIFSFIIALIHVMRYMPSINAMFCVSFVYV